ncbi:MAG: hypothetical protein JRF33_11800 [Deltaproteobacteria bacterium]|nr:hypothetical protein [Deltaproteobacteria bacterium]
MKKIVLVLAVFAALGMMIGCGSSDNDCDKAADVLISGMDDYCGANAADCKYCECYNAGQVVNADGDCEDPANVDPGDPVPCEGDALTGAQNCLADEAACKAVLYDATESMCQAEHVMDTCADDSECVLGMTCDTTTGYCSMS